MNKEYTTQEVGDIVELYGSIQLTYGISDSAQSPVPDENRLRFLVEARDVELPRLKSMIDSELQERLDIKRLEGLISERCATFESNF